MSEQDHISLLDVDTLVTRPINLNIIRDLHAIPPRILAPISTRSHWPVVSLPISSELKEWFWGITSGSEILNAQVHCFSNYTINVFWLIVASVGRVGLYMARTVDSFYTMLGRVFCCWVVGLRSKPRGNLQNFPFLSDFVYDGSGLSLQINYTFFMLLYNKIGLAHRVIALRIP